MKIVVTGLGVVSGIGIGKGANIASLRQGKHGMEKPRYFSTRLDVPVSEVKRSNEELKELLDIAPGKTCSRTALLGMLAAKEAMDDAGITPDKFRIGLISSTSIGGMDRSENFYEAFREHPDKGRLREVASHDCGDSTDKIASWLGINGFTTTISTACSSAGNAIMLGARLIRHGIVDAVIAGGTDALCRFTLNGFNSLKILDAAHCRPFDTSRMGLNLGEGAGYLVLQREEEALRPAYCSLSGFANTNEAFHQTGSSPAGDGPYHSMREALEKAGIRPEEVDYINVHGTGTPNNDLSESQALIRIFGNSVPSFSSVKPFIGHTLGASEGIEAVYSVLSVKNGYRYPNLNFNGPIAETGLIPETLFTEENRIRNVLSNSFGFGGNNTTLIFSTLNE